jgi:polysaccharide biosynthesis/export protein
VSQPPLGGALRTTVPPESKIVNPKKLPRDRVSPQPLQSRHESLSEHCVVGEAAPRAIGATSRPTFILSVGRVVGCAVASASLLGCEVDSWMDPSRTGYFETTPTTMPVLARLDVIERGGVGGTQAGPPIEEDLVPAELKYRLSPADEIRVEVWELIEVGRTEILEVVVDQTGNIRIKELGDVAAAGLTIEELQKEIEAKASRIIRGTPVVGVSLIRGQGFQFSISGSVQTVGVFGLNRPDFRIAEAIALAGGALPTTQRVTVVRSAPLDDTLNPVYPEPEARNIKVIPPITPVDDITPPTPGTGGAAPAPSSGTTPAEAKPAVDINDLIDQLDSKARQPDAPAGGAAPATDPAATPPTTPPATQPGASPGMLKGSSSRGPRVFNADDAPPIDVDDVTSPTVQDAVTAPVAADSTQAVGAGGWVFDTAAGRWIRGGAPSTSGPRGSDNAAAARPMYATRIIEIDYQALIRGDQNLNIVVRPGDQIYVEPPETGFVYIDGEINRPGVYEIQNTNGRLTLSRFVSAAGGLSPTAIPNRVDLVRVIGKDREATIRVDLAAIRNRSEPDIYMRPDDHVIIGTNLIATPLAVIRNGFRMTYGFGFLLDRNFGNDVFGPPPEASPFN